MDWHDILRHFRMPLSAMLDAETGHPRFKLDLLDGDSVGVRRTALYGACMAAATAPPPSTRLSHGLEVSTWVDTETARLCFESASANPVSCAEVLRVFRPTVFLLEENLRGRDCSYYCLEDDAAPFGIYSGFVTIARIERPRIRTLGEAFFIPPVSRGDGRMREAWLDSRRLDPPRCGEPGGPFWRLGRHARWRLDVLAWNEILVLAALLGTNAKEAVVVAPRHLLPRVGFVAEQARQLERTLIGVPLEACPRPLRGMLREFPVSERGFEMALFSSPEVTGGEAAPVVAAPPSRRQRPR